MKSFHWLFIMWLITFIFWVVFREEKYWIVGVLLSGMIFVKTKD